MIAAGLVVIAVVFVIGPVLIVFVDWVVELRRSRDYYRRRWMAAALDAQEHGCQQYRLFTRYEGRSL